jgi:ligand-binding SRPBCC domain-containing protein
MSYRARVVKDPNLVSGAERAVILEERLSALGDATRVVTGADPLPVAWRTNWKASVKILGRDRDGCLLFEVCCTGPGLKFPYRRKRRLVPQSRLKVR